MNKQEIKKIKKLQEKWLFWIKIDNKKGTQG